MRSFHDYKKLHPTQIRDYKMKYIFTIVLVYVLGHWGWPFAAYMLSCDIGILVYIIAATSVLISIIFFLVSFIKGSSRNLAWWALTVFLGSVCSLHYILNEFGENAHYTDEYMPYYDYSICKETNTDNYHGIVDKWGRKVIPPSFFTVVQIFSKTEKKSIFIGVQLFGSRITKEGEFYKSGEFYFFDNIKVYGMDNFVLKKIVKVEKSDYETVKEHIEAVYGRILDVYARDSYFFKRCVRLEPSNTKLIKDAANELIEDLTKEDTSNSQSDNEGNKNNTHSSQDGESPSYTPEYGQRDVWVDCMNCMGSGKCPSCHGNGWCVSTWSDGSYNDTYQCPICHGGGRCQMCYGTKGHYEKQIYQIK